MLRVSRRHSRNRLFVSVPSAKGVGDQFSVRSQRNSGYGQIFRQVLESAATEPAQLPLLTWNQAVRKFRALGLADAKAVNRSARRRSPRRCRVHRSLAKFFSSGCFSCLQWFIWNISALSCFTEAGQHEFRLVAPWSLQLSMNHLPSCSFPQSDENEVAVRACPHSDGPLVSFVRSSHYTRAGNSANLRVLWHSMTFYWKPKRR